MLSILRAFDSTVRLSFDPCRDDQDAKAKIIAKQIEVDIPTASVQRHVEVLDEDRAKVSKVPVRTDTTEEPN
jgi:hypothetical protein